MEARAKNYLRDAGLRSGGTASVDMSSFPLLILHQIPLAGTEILERALGELEAMLATLPAASPLFNYAERQQSELVKELSKRSAAARVERLILGLERTPSVESLPIISPEASTNCGNLAGGAMPVRKRRVSSIHMPSSSDRAQDAEAVPTAPSRRNHGSNVTVASTASTDNATCITATDVVPASIATNNNTSSTLPATFTSNSRTKSTDAHSKPCSSAERTDSSSISPNTQPAKSYSSGNVSRPTSAASSYDDGDPVKSMYSQKALRLERMRKKASQQQVGWGQSFVIGGGKKKKWENKIAKRRRAEERKRNADEKRRADHRKATRTSKHLQSVREMLRIKKLRRKERAKRRKVLEDLRQQMNKQSAVGIKRDEVQSVSSGIAKVSGKATNTVNIYDERSRKERAAVTTPPASSSNLSNSFAPERALPSATAAASTIFRPVLVDNPPKPPVAHAVRMPTSPQETLSSVLPRSQGLDDDYSDSDDIDNDDEDNLEEQQERIARIDKALRKLDDCQKRDDDMERELIKDPDKFMVLGPIKEISDEAAEEALKEAVDSGKQLRPDRSTLDINLDNEKTGVLRNASASAGSSGYTNENTRQQGPSMLSGDNNRKPVQKRHLRLPPEPSDVAPLDVAPMSTRPASMSEMPPAASNSQYGDLDTEPPKLNITSRVSDEARTLARGELSSVRHRGGRLLPGSPDRPVSGSTPGESETYSNAWQGKLQKDSSGPTGSIYADVLCNDSQSSSGSTAASDDDEPFLSPEKALPPTQAEKQNKNKLTKMQVAAAVHADIEDNGGGPTIPGESSGSIISSTSVPSQNYEATSTPSTNTASIPTDKILHPGDDSAPPAPSSEPALAVNNDDDEDEECYDQESFEHGDAMTRFTKKTESKLESVAKDNCENPSNKVTESTPKGPVVEPDLERVPSTNTAYSGFFNKFGDIFTAAHDTTSSELNRRGGSSRSLTGHGTLSRRSGNKKRNTPFDEEAYLVYHIETLKQWFAELGAYENAFSDDRLGKEGGGLLLSPRSRAESMVTNNFVKGMYYVTRQSRGRSEMVDIVTATMENADTDWTRLPPCLSGGAGRRGDGSATAHYWNFIWTWSRPRVKYERLLSWQRVNHFPGARHLTRKDCLKRNLDRYTKVPGKLADNFRLLPDTFCLPKEYLSFVETFSRVAEEEELKYPHRPPGSMNWWILKPAGLSRGRGINVVNDICQVTYGSDAVIQRYIMNPHLLDGYKYDLRIYVLVTSFNPLEAFVYKEGFVRFSTVPYSTEPSSVGNKFIHLTNSSIQKHNMGSVPNANNSARSAAQSAHPADRASASEKGGTKLKLSYLWRRFQEDGIDADKVRSDIEAVLVKTLMVANDAIPNQINSFELYGFDIMLDAKLKPWLIEVNASPSLGCDFQVDIDVKHKLMQDTMRLIDPLEFDRGLLLEELELRLKDLRKEKKRPFANPSAMYSASHGKRTKGQQRLDHMLNLVLGGRTPRVPAITPPAHLGGYRQIAPGGKIFEMTQKLMQKCLHSHRRKGISR